MKRINFSIVIVLFLTLLYSINLFAQEKHSITIEDLWSMHRLANLELSPDGKTIAFTAQVFDMESNRGKTSIYLINSDGTNLREFKPSEKNQSQPRFSPDSKKLAFTREGSIWIANSDGTSEEQLTTLHTGASGLVWSNDGKKILFVSSVYPDCSTDECNKLRDEEKEQSKVKASIFTELMYRHWDHWREDKKSHLFIMDIETKRPVDLTLFSNSDVPPISLGSARDYTFSPDGKEIAFVMNPDPFIATSTNNEIFTINIDEINEGYRPPYQKISESSGNDNQAVYSPDGRYIAFCSMEREGFEADKQRLMLYDRESKALRSLTDNFDYSVGEIVWSPNSRYIYFNAADEVNRTIFKFDLTARMPEVILKEGVNVNLNISPDGKTLYFRHQNATLPYEVFAMDTDGSNLRQITFMNKENLANLEMNPIETFWSEGAEGARVQSILLKPPFFDPSKKYPMVFLIHGGPQGHWADDFHFRWNMQMFAAPGYVVIAPNPRGSTAYGQQYTDEISQDWGGKVYEDLMKAYDYAIENFSFIDEKNTFAAGASYGGYMINWIAGHTDRFSALVSHAGVFNTESMYGTTEELWFVEWEFGGTPWENRELYRKWSPHLHIHNAKTPMLITHGAFDFRVSEEQGFQLFTHLQRLGVESKFLYFPDESHWIQKPQNARLWWNTIYDWYNTYTKKEE